MAEESGPRTFGTPAYKQFTRDQWSSLYAADTGITNDYDGTAYGITRVLDTDTIRVGSSTQVSSAKVAGRGHFIPKGESVTLTIPPATGTAVTQVIALRYDPAWTQDPGPVRLVNFPAASGAGGVMPDPSTFGAGVVHLPLWTITRQPNQTLTQATIRSLRSWVCPEILLDTTADLPVAGVPIGTFAQRGRTILQRQLVSGAPAWVDPTTVPLPPQHIEGLSSQTTFSTTTTLAVGAFTVPRATAVTITVQANIVNPSGQRIGVDVKVANQFLNGVHRGDFIASGTLSLTVPYQATAGSHYIDVRMLPSASQTAQVTQLTALVVPV